MARQRQVLRRVAQHLGGAQACDTSGAAAPAALTAEEAIPRFVTEAQQLPIASDVRKGLSADEVAQFRRDGYVAPLPLFAEGAVSRLQAKALEMFQALESVAPGSRVDRVNMWQKANLFCYELSRTPAILDYVESLTGPNFFQWGCHMFVKEPHDGSVVPWHQDAQYWPLTPQRTVTVWLAFWDADESNSALRIVRGSHKHGRLRHHSNDAENYVLNQELPASSSARTGPPGGPAGCWFVLLVHSAWEIH